MTIPAVSGVPGLCEAVVGAECLGQVGEQSSGLCRLYLGQEVPQLLLQLLYPRRVIVQLLDRWRV